MTVAFKVRVARRETGARSVPSLAAPRPAGRGDAPQRERNPWRTAFLILLAVVIGFSSGWAYVNFGPSKLQFSITDAFSGNPVDQAIVSIYSSGSLAARCFTQEGACSLSVSPGHYQGAIASSNYSSKQFAVDAQGAFNVYVLTVNPTFSTVVQPGSMAIGCSYLVFTDSVNFFGKSCKSGSVDYSSSNAGLVIQPAINASTSSGLGSLIIQAGTYPLTFPLTIFPNGNSVSQGFDLSGVGWSTILTTPLNSANTAIVVGKNAGTPTYEVSISNLQVLGSSGFNTNGNGMTLMGTGGLLVNHVQITGVGGYGILIQGGVQAQVITNSRIGGVSSSGIRAESDVYLTISDTEIHANSWYGIEQVSTANSSIASNQITYNGFWGVSLGAGIGNTVIGNIFYHNGQSLANTYDQVITGGTYNIVKGNNFEDTAAFKTERDCYHETGSADFNLVTGNACYSSSRLGSGVTITGAHTLIINNAGYNPVGKIVSFLQPTLNYIGLLGNFSTLTSAKIYTTVGVPLNIYWTGGTVSAQTVDGNSVPPMVGSLNTIHLEPGDTYSITFTVAPTTFLVIGE